MINRKSKLLNIGGRIIVSTEFHVINQHRNDSWFEENEHTILEKHIYPLLSTKIFKNGNSKSKVAEDFHILEDDYFIMIYKFRTNVSKDQIMLPRLQRKLWTRPGVETRGSSQYKHLPLYQEKLNVTVLSKQNDAHLFEQTLNEVDKSINCKYFEEKNDDLIKKKNEILLNLSTRLNASNGCNLEGSSGSKARITTPQLKNFKNNISKFARKEMNPIENYITYKPDGCLKEKEDPKKENVSPKLTATKIESSSNKDFDCKPLSDTDDFSNPTKMKKKKSAKIKTYSRKRKNNTSTRTLTKKARNSDESLPSLAVVSSSKSESENEIQTDIHNNQTNTLTINDLLKANDNSMTPLEDPVDISLLTEENTMLDEHCHVIQKHIKAIKLLSLDEISKLVKSFERDLKNILKGKTQSERHDIYKKGGKERGLLEVNYKVVGLFNEEQDDKLSKTLLKIFCEKSTKYFDYVMKVMVAEVTVMIYSHVNHVSREEANQILIDKF